MRLRRVNMNEKGRKFVSVPCNYLKIKLCGRCFGGRGGEEKRVRRASSIICFI